MPHYYKITNHHGQGRNGSWMQRHCLYRAIFADAQIELWKEPMPRLKKMDRESMALCCDFLLRRLSLLCMDIKQKYSFEQRRMVLMKHHDSMWINIFNSTCAYYYALIGRVEQIPEIFSNTDFRL